MLHVLNPDGSSNVVKYSATISFSADVAGTYVIRMYRTAPQREVKRRWRSAGRPMPLKVWARACAALDPVWGGACCDWLSNKRARSGGLGWVTMASAL